MPKELLHRAALEALLHVATQPRTWRTRSQLAADCGFSASTFSMALADDPDKQRGLSDAALASLCDVLGIKREALMLPWVATSGDLRTVELDRRLRAVQDELTDLHRAFRDHQRGD